MTFSSFVNGHKVANLQSKSRSNWLSALGLVLAGIFTATNLQAHELQPAVADIHVQDQQAQITLILTAEAMLSEMDLSDVNETTQTEQSDEYDRLRALNDADLIAQVEENWDHIKGQLNFDGGGALQLVSVEVLPVEDVELPRDTVLTLHSDLPATWQSLSFGWQAENGLLVVRFHGGEDPITTLIEGGQMSPEFMRSGESSLSAGQAFVHYVYQGILHIIPMGLDHILFVLGLFFFALAWRPLLAQVTAFTLAHTVTLALASLGVIVIPASSMWLVESLIALSITYVAVENILRPKLGWWRIVVVFGFGLLHGLGFASVLGDLGLASGQFILSLIAFNIGVEFGQLAVIAGAAILLALPFALMSKRVPNAWTYYRRGIVIPGSLAIALIGLWWFIERAILG